MDPINDLLIVTLKESLKIFCESILGSDNIILCVDFAMKELKNVVMNGPAKKEVLMKSFQLLAEELHGEVLVDEIGDIVEQLYTMSKKLYKKSKRCCFLCCCCR